MHCLSTTLKLMSPIDHGLEYAKLRTQIKIFSLYVAYLRNLLQL